MSDVSRRDLLRSIGASVLLSGAVSTAAAQRVHQIAAEEKSAGAYKPKAFNDHEYRTLEKLADLIVPADEVSPGAAAAGAPAFIDLLSSQNPRLAAIYTGGMAWLDTEMSRRCGANFIDARPEQRTALLDVIAYRKNESAATGPGIYFFDWARKMVVDAFYTSPAGIKDLGYLGNTAVAEFEIPRAAIDYALGRSPA